MLNQNVKCISWINVPKSSQVWLDPGIEPWHLSLMALLSSVLPLFSDSTWWQKGCLQHQVYILLESSPIEKATLLCRLGRSFTVPRGLEMTPVPIPETTTVVKRVKCSDWPGQSHEHLGKASPVSGYIRGATVAVTLPASILTSVLVACTSLTHDIPESHIPNAARMISLAWKSGLKLSEGKLFVYPLRFSFWGPAN